MAAVKLALHVTPRSGRDCVSGIKHQEEPFGTEIFVRVTAPPDGGKANKAVCKILAKELGVSKSSVTLVRGDTSRHKLVEIDMPEDQLRAWVGALPKL